MRSKAYHISLLLYQHVQDLVLTTNLITTVAWTCDRICTHFKEKTIKQDKKKNYAQLKLVLVQYRIVSPCFSRSSSSSPTLLILQILNGQTTSFPFTIFSKPSPL